MQYRRLGRTELRVSSVGFGTAQLRLVPEQQAIDALKVGISLGVNIIHTAPDYEGTQELVAQAVAESRRNVIVCSQGYGDREHMEWLFEQACRNFNRQRLELFGVACVDDREMIGENVWEPGGHIEFLMKMKEKGRLQGIFCTTHGSPDYIRGLLQSNVFDAIMLAYNPLGFHLLSYNQRDKPADIYRESLAENFNVFSDISRQDIGLIVMKPLAGGLLCEGKAFIPFFRSESDLALPSASQMLRFILCNHPEVSCVMPGTASIEEARENAEAGHEPLSLPENRQAAVSAVVHRLQGTLCSRCGRCDELCSKGLPISWLFRDAYINNHRGMTFETLEQLRYCVLHPWKEPLCATCADVTCDCPSGIDIPRALVKLHEQVQEMHGRGSVTISPERLRNRKEASKLPFDAFLYSKDFPSCLKRDGRPTFLLAVKNCGALAWKSPIQSAGVYLQMFVDLKQVQRARLRSEIPPGEIAHFALGLTAVLKRGIHSFRFVLVNESLDEQLTSVDLATFDLEVV